MFRDTGLDAFLDGLKRAQVCFEVLEKAPQEVPIFNCFVDTTLSYRFSLNFSSKKETVENAVNAMIDDREGLFVLLVNRSLSAEEASELYRSRNGGGRVLTHSDPRTG